MPSLPAETCFSLHACRRNCANFVPRHVKKVHFLIQESRTRSRLLFPFAVGRGLRFGNGARGGAGPSFRCSLWGFARIPLCFDAPAVVSREFWPLVASSGIFWGGHLGCRPQRRRRWGGLFVSRSRCGFARIPASSGFFWEGPPRLWPPFGLFWPSSLFGV